MQQADGELPLVSVIMAAYNTAPTLCEAVSSIKQQTYKHWQLHLLIEPSPDNTLEIARELAASDPRILLTENEKKLGVSGNRNKGILHAKGKYIAILDADDVALPERLEKQVAFLEEHADIYLVGAGNIRIDWDGTEQETLPQTVTTPEEIAALLPESNQFTHSTVMYRNQEQPFYREKIFYGEDYDFFLRLLATGKRLANISEPLVKYRASMSSETFNSYSWEIQKMMLDTIKIWYHQRISTGQDEYEKFDATQFKTNAQSLSAQELAWQRIRVAIRANNFLAVRQNSVAYMKNYGVTLKVLAAWIVSFLPKKLAVAIKKVRGNTY